MTTNKKDLHEELYDIINDVGFYSLDDSIDQLEETLKKQNHDIKELCLQTIDVEDEHITVLAKYLKNIESIDLNYCERISDKGFSGLAKCVKLHTINLRATRVGDEGLLAIANACKNLENIDLFFCDQISENGYIQFFKITKLKKVTLYSKAITQNVIKTLVDNSKYIAHLILSGNESITDDTLLFMSKGDSCYNLRSLYLDGCKNISKNSLLDIVSHCPNLEVLDISSCNVDNEALIKIMRVDSNIQKIVLSECTGINNEGVLRAKKFKPNVIFESCGYNSAF